MNVGIQVYYNPLVLAADGADIDGNTKPVELAILSFLRTLPFNGRLRKTALTNAILAVPGVIDVKIITLAHKYGSGSYNAVDISCIPESGYFKIDADYPLAENIIYIAATNNV